MDGRDATAIRPWRLALRKSMAAKLLVPRCHCRITSLSCAPFQCLGCLVLSVPPRTGPDSHLCIAVAEATFIDVAPVVVNNVNVNACAFGECAVAVHLQQLWQVVRQG